MGIVIAGTITLERASVVLAHEGELHLAEGFVLTPLTIAILGGAAVGLFLIGFFLWVWARRSLKRKEAQQGQLQSASAKGMTSARENSRQEG